MRVSRRTFLEQSAIGAASVALVASARTTLRAAPLGLPIGSQTYPHRARIASGDFAGLLKDMKAIGIDVVELCNPTYNEFKILADGKQTRKILDDNGMKCLSAHFSMNALRNDHQRQIDWALQIGMTQMSTASLGGAVKDGATTLDEVKRAADEYNKIAAAAAKNNLAQALHNEGFENSVLPDGRRTYFALMEHLDPKLVRMQFQMSSARGLDINPISFFQMYPGRFISLHLQGVNMNPPPPFVPPTAAGAAAPAEGGRGRGGRGGGGGGGYAVGSDDLEWGRIFQAARIGGIQNYFVEQTWPLTVLSVAFLKNLDV